MASSYSNEEWSARIIEAKEWLDEHKSTTQQHQSITNRATLADYIDHTQLKLDATPEDISRLCSEAKSEGFHTVCVRENYVKQAVAELEGSKVKVACVIGFHEGTYSTKEKCDEAISATEQGAKELDVVLNRRPLLQNDYRATYQELAEIRRIAPPPVLLKLILETSQLRREDMVAASIIAGHAGFDFIKTSTGFNGRGASLDDVVLMNSCTKYLYENGVPSKSSGRDQVRVKASGGIRSYEDAVKMIKAGASRLGTSGGLAIVNGLTGEGTGGTAEKGVEADTSKDTY